MNGVTVIIPTRDRPELLECAISSVLLQTVPAAQIIVVDDGSRDAAAVARACEASPNVTLVRHDTSRGAAAARNRGLDLATGEFVLFLDDDDLIHPRLIEEALATAAAREADVVVFLYECIFTPTDLSATYPVALLFDYRRLARQPLTYAHQGAAVTRFWIEDRTAAAFMRYTIPIQSCFLRRNAIGTLRFPESLKHGEDTYFLISLARGGRRFVLNPHVYAYVRRHSGNITSSPDRILHVEECYRKMIADGLLTTPDDIFLARLKVFLMRLRSGHGLRLREAGALLRSPALLYRELSHRVRNLRARRSLLKYYAS